MNRECAGLQVRSNTLKANRETEIVSMCDRGPYGQIEDFTGSITVEVLGSCMVSPECQRAIAIHLANDEVEAWLEVDEWDVLWNGRYWQLEPRSWSEKETKKH